MQFNKGQKYINLINISYNKLGEIMKKFYYVVLGILILIFFTSDINNNEIMTIDNPNDILVLTNKKRKLENSYIPNDLTLLSLKFSHSDKYLRKEAAINFEKLSLDASKLGYTIIAVSTYRSYDYQEKLFSNYVKNKGYEYASNCCAKAGFSEHQTGLAVDVEGSNHDYDNFEDCKEFNWMKNNAHKYGFILRYPKGKEDITGFKYEPWHYRYVGIDIATYIYNNNLTLEEYLKL